MVGSVMPESNRSADDSTEDGDGYPGHEGPVRRPGSRPLADLFAGPTAVLAGIAVVFIVIPALIGACWLGAVLLGAH